MDLARLRALRELSHRGTMAAVAEALHLTPSAVSQQLALLEEEIGLALTERQGRGVKLTAAGELLVSHTEQILTVMDEARSELALLKKQVVGKLRVATFPTVAAALLPSVIKRLSTDYPHLEVQLSEMEPADGLAALGSWGADIAFVDDLTLRLSGKEKLVQQVHVLDDQLYALLPAEHRLAGKSTVTVAELKSERWALDSALSFYAEFVMNLCRRAGYEPRVNAECRGFEIICAMVQGGCSVSVIPGLRLIQPIPGTVAVKLRPEVSRRISLAYRRGEHRNPAVQLFVQGVQQESAAYASRKV